MVAVGRSSAASVGGVGDHDRQMVHACASVALHESMVRGKGNNPPSSFGAAPGSRVAASLRQGRQPRTIAAPGSDRRVAVFDY